MPYDQGGNWAPGIMYDQGGNPYCDQPPDDWGKRERRKGLPVPVWTVRAMTPAELKAAREREEVSATGSAEAS